MQINTNNNQTSFGMKSVNSYNTSKRLSNLISKSRPKILAVGHPAADCIITKGKKKGEVFVQVTIGVSDAPVVAGEAKGRVFTKKGLLKLVEYANDAMNQTFINLKIKGMPRTEDFNFGTEPSVHAGGKLVKLGGIIENGILEPIKLDVKSQILN